MNYPCDNSRWGFTRIVRFTGSLNEVGKDVWRSSGLVPQLRQDMHSRLSTTLSRSLLKITKEGDSTSSHWLCLQPQLLALLLPKPCIREKVAQVFSLLSKFNCPTGGEMSTRAKLRETAGQARKDKWASPIHSSKLLDQFTLVKCHLMRIRQKKNSTKEWFHCWNVWLVQHP